MGSENSAQQIAAPHDLQYSTLIGHRNFQKPVIRRLNSPDCAAFRARSVLTERLGVAGFDTYPTFFFIADSLAAPTASSAQSFERAGPGVRKRKS